MKSFSKFKREVTALKKIAEQYWERRRQERYDEWRMQKAAQEMIRQDMEAAKHRTEDRLFVRGLTDEDVQRVRRWLAS